MISPAGRVIEVVTYSGSQRPKSGWLPGARPTSEIVSARFNESRGGTASRTYRGGYRSDRVPQAPAADALARLIDRCAGALAAK